MKATSTTDFAAVAVAAAAVAAALSGCGGGGDSGTRATAPAPTTQLAAYVGTWSTACSNHRTDSIAVGRPAGATDSVTVAYRTDYYLNADCTGPILATVTQSADATATFAGSVDASIVPTPGAAPITVRVDKVTASVPSYTLNVTGTGVVKSVVNGTTQWCVNFGNGGASCIEDKGTYAAQTNVAGGIAISGNTLYDLDANGSSWTVDEIFTRK